MTRRLRLCLCTTLCIVAALLVAPIPQAMSALHEDTVQDPAGMITETESLWRVEIPRAPEVDPKTALDYDLPPGFRVTQIARAPDGSVYLLCNNFTPAEGLPQRDLVLAKYSVDGERLWYEIIDNGSNEIGWCIETDADGNVYIAGMVSQAAGRRRAGGNFAFVASFTASGRSRWAHVEDDFPGINDRDTAFTMYYDISIQGDALYATGSIRGRVDRGQRADTRGEDLLVSRFRLNGRKVWSRQYSGDTRFNDRAGLGITAHRDRVYVVGLDSAVDRADAPGPANMDSLVMCLNGEGEIAWQHQFGEVPNPELPGMEGIRGRHESATSVAVDSAGNVYVAGFTNGELDGQAKPDGWELADHPYLVKFSPQGQTQWVRELIAPMTHSLIRDLHIDAEDRIWAVGSARWRTDTLPHRLIVMRYNTDGELVGMLRRDHPESHTGDMILYDYEQDQLIVSGRYTQSSEGAAIRGVQNPYSYVMRIPVIEADD